MPTAAEYEYIIRVTEPDAPSTWRYLASTHGRSTTSGTDHANYAALDALAEAVEMLMPPAEERGEARPKP